MVLLPLIDCFLMKSQTGKLQDVKNFWTVPKAKGSLYFDIIGYTGHKKYRDYYPFFIGETELVFLMAILICCLSFSDLVQNITLLVVSLVSLMSLIILSQFTLMKILKLVLNLLILVFFVFCLIICFNYSPSVSSAKTLGFIVLLVIMILLSFNLLILLIRIYDLMVDAPTTYGERAKPVPPQKIRSSSSNQSKH